MAMFTKNVKLAISYVEMLDDDTELQVVRYGTLKITEQTPTTSGYLTLNFQFTPQQGYPEGCWATNYYQNEGKVVNTDWLRINGTSTKITITSAYYWNEAYNVTIQVPSSYQGKTVYIDTSWGQSSTFKLATTTGNAYVITYNSNGHGTPPAQQTKNKGASITLQPFMSNVTSTFTIFGNANGGTWTGNNGTATSGLSQVEWNTAADGSGTSYGSGASFNVDANTTLYAIWAADASQGSYTLPSGTPSMAGSQTTYTAYFNGNNGTSTKTSQSATNTITYSFTGWFTQPEGGEQRTTSSRVTKSENVYAHYSKSVGSASTVTCPTITQCTRSGYILKGFSIDKTAIIPTYLPGQELTISGASPDIEDGAILYAIWQGNSYTGWGTVYHNSDYNMYCI